VQVTIWHIDQARLSANFGSELSPRGIDHGGGETYLDKGDGLIAMWNQADAFRCAAISGL
jgi:hypothetical protein